MREKGIFIGSSDKNITVPMLSSTLLTPPEFLKLIEDSVSRELKPKIRSYQYKLSKEQAGWQEGIRAFFKEKDNLQFKLEGNVSVKLSPMLTTLDKDKVKISYCLTRKDISQDWIRREVDYPGYIVFEKKNDELILEAVMSRTSKETNEFNKKILKKVAASLKNESIITDDKEDKITYGSFLDSEHVLFFKRLTSGINGYLKLGSVNDVEVGRDEGMPEIPNDLTISWMNQTVRKILIDGEYLNDIFLIREKKYYKYYYVQKMDITYKYIFGQNIGSVKVSFYFQFNKNQNRKEAEFEYEVISVKSESGRLNRDSKIKIQNDIDENVRNLVGKEYNKIVDERVSSDEGLLSKEV